jgi:hypothetical protein
LQIFRAFRGVVPHAPQLTAAAARLGWRAQCERGALVLATMCSKRICASAALPTAAHASASRTSVSGLSGTLRPSSCGQKAVARSGA